MGRYYVYFSDTGTPKTGLTPVFDTWRYGDGSAPGSTPTVTELSAANAPGWYYFDFEPVQTLLVTVDSDDVGMGANERYVPTLIDPFDEAAKRAVQLLGEHVVTVWSTYDAEGRPLTGEKHCFASKSDADAAYAAETYTAAVETYTITQAYDGLNRPIKHSMVREP